MIDEKTTNADESLVIPDDPPQEFFIAGRQLFQDSKISLEARAIVGYVLSKPPNWKVRVRDLMIQGGVGRDKLRRIFKELIHGGYMQRERVKGRGGRFDWRFRVASVKKFKVYDLPYTEKPATGEPATDNTAIYKEKNLKNIEASALAKNARATRAVKKVKTYMPDDFKVYDEPKREVAHKMLGKHASKLNPESIFEKFVADAEAKGLAYVDWLAAWRSRCKQELYYATRDGIVKADDDGERVLSIREKRQRESEVSR
jgi:hypothetical protein